MVQRDNKINHGVFLWRDSCCENASCFFCDHGNANGNGNGNEIEMNWTESACGSCDHVNVIWISNENDGAVSQVCENENENGSERENGVYKTKKMSLPFLEEVVYRPRAPPRSSLILQSLPKCPIIASFTISRKTTTTTLIPKTCN